MQKNNFFEPPSLSQISQPPLPTKRDIICKRLLATLEKVREETGKNIRILTQWGPDPGAYSRVFLEVNSPFGEVFSVCSKNFWILPIQTPSLISFW